MTVRLDHISDLRAVEDRGADSSMIRTALVTGLSDTDFAVLWSALDAAGVPAALSVPSGHTNLVLVRREATLVQGDPSAVNVSLEYATRAEAQTAFVFEFFGSLSQVTSEKDRFDEQITLAHTFPATDEDFPSETRTQGGSINVSAPQMVARATGLITDDYPHWIVAEWMGRINSTRWADGPAYRWLCTNVTAVLFDYSTSPRTSQFTFEFQYEHTGWQPGVAFIDSRDGTHPPDLVENVGYKTVIWYPAIDFNERFPI